MIIKKINHDQTYPIRHQVMWPEQDLDYVKLKDDEKALHFAIEEDEDLQAVVSLFINHQKAQLRKLATKPNYRNRSFASNLITHCISIAKANMCKEIWLNSRSSKISFYQRFGFESTPEQFNKGGINYTIMKLKLH